MRTVGHRIEHPISFSASAEALAEGAHFNDAIHILPTGMGTRIRKGVYHFKTHSDANRHELDCVVDYVAQMAQMALKKY